MTIHMTSTFPHSFAMLRAATLRTLVTGIAVATLPALLTAQDCLGLHAPRSVPVAEVTAGFLRDGITGPSTLGVGVTKGALFGLLETGADVAAQRSALAFNGFGATMGYRKAIRGVALCGGASLAGETVVNGTTNAGGVFAAAGVPLPTLLKQVPISAFGMATLASRTTTPSGGSSISDRGVALRVGLSSYPKEWIGVRVWEDIASGEHRFGMSVSLNRNIKQQVVEEVVAPPAVREEVVVAPADSDGDGVVDTMDACPNTPAGTKVDAKGCTLPPPDADGDGVIDALDACPNTPIGTVVDAKGCPIVVPAPIFTFSGVNFESSKSVLLPTAVKLLDEAVAILTANPSVRVEIAGHADTSGNARSNLRLSQARAESVRQYLIRNGIASDRLTVRGFGSTRPVAPNATIEGRAANRRVEITKID